MENLRGAEAVDAVALLVDGIGIGVGGKEPPSHAVRRG